MSPSLSLAMSWPWSTCSAYLLSVRSSTMSPAFLTPASTLSCCPPIASFALSKMPITVHLSEKFWPTFFLLQVPKNVDSRPARYVC